MDKMRNRYKKEQNGGIDGRKGLYFTILGLFITFCLMVGMGTGLLFAFYDDLPSLAPLEDYTSGKWHLPTKIYSRNGEQIATFYEERREIVPIEQLPPALIEAIISVEDSRFFEHNGVDFRGIARAAYQNLQAGRVVEGGSTITQQLAKVLFLTPKQTFKRKFKEALLALKIERNYTKKEIMERYFNKIYFGSGAYGVEAASRVYFDKSVRDIDLAEAAMLAGLPKAPSYYSPYQHPERAQRRQRTVLNLMVNHGYLSQDKADSQYQSFWEDYEERRYSITARRNKKKREGSYFIELIRKKLLNRYGADVVYRGGLEVQTTVNMDYQKKLEEQMFDYLLEFNKTHGELRDKAETIPLNADTDYVQGAAFVKDPRSGEVLATVGGHDWNTSNQLNRATQARRQPGSAFKPILYTAALDNGYTIASRLQDRPLIYNTPQGDWIPENYSKRYHGEVTLREALVHSMNVATVDLLEKIGADVMIDYAHKLGIRASLSPYKSIALGGLEHGITLAELTNVYSVFANKGIRTDAIFIREVRDREGNLLERNFPYKQEVLSPQVAAIVTNLLKAVVDEGTGRSVGRHFERPIAGKTGTTNDFRDAWFMGYTPQIVMGTWFGYDESNRSIGQNMTGSRVAGRFWSNAAKILFKNRQPQTFPVPSELNFINIDPETGYLYTPRCPRSVREPFLPGTEPTQPCPVHTNPKWPS